MTSPLFRRSLHRTNHLHPALHVGVLKPRVFQRDRDLPVEEEQHVNPELRPESSGKPNSVLLPLVHDVEPHPRHIGAQHCAHHKWNPGMPWLEYGTVTGPNIHRADVKTAQVSDVPDSENLFSPRCSQDPNII